VGEGAASCDKCNQEQELGRHFRNINKVNTKKHSTQITLETHSDSSGHSSISSFIHSFNSYWIAIITFIWMVQLTEIQPIEKQLPPSKSMWTGISEIKARGKCYDI